MANTALDLLAEPVRRRIAAGVVGIFNDPARGERPVTRRAHGLFGPESVAWRVHGDVASMMVGGVAGLLLQMLLPEVLAGVWDHSRFRTDMHGRLRRTARFIALTTYGERAEAEAAIARVRMIHDQVRGQLPDGRGYAANDPQALAWVHATETVSFLDAYRRHVAPDLTAEDADRYFREMAEVGARLGAAPVPHDAAGARALIDGMRPRLRSDARTREVARLVLDRRLDEGLAAPAGAVVRQAAIDLLPSWARAMHGLPSPPLARPLVRAGAGGVSRLLRWALA